MPSAGQLPRLAALLVLLTVRTAAAQTGSVAGQVTDASSGVGISNLQVQFYNISGSLSWSVSTQPDGTYALAVAPGRYYLRTNVQFNQPYVNQLYPNISCADLCPPHTGSPVDVSAGGTAAGVNFALDRTGSIAGTVTSLATGLPISDATVQVHDSDGVFRLGKSTAANGTFTASGLAPGTYFLHTTVSPGQNYLNQFFGGPLCGATCSPIGGTPVVVAGGATTGGADFALSTAGSISGAVTDSATGLPLVGIGMRAYSPNGSQVGFAMTAADGTYAIVGLPSSGYRVTADTRNTAATYQSEVHADIPCLPQLCATTPGTTVPVAAGAASTVNFGLAAGGAITGTVTDLTSALPIGGLTVAIYNSSGLEVSSSATNSAGTYLSAALPPGSYFVRARPASSQNYLGKVFPNVLCQGSCVITAGNPVVLGLGTVQAGINFQLASGGSIGGVITHALTGVPLQGVTVQIHLPSGAPFSSAFVDSSGNFTASGLPSGTYFARTSSTQYANELFGGLPCIANCLVTAGTPIGVTAGTLTGGVDFALSAGGSIAGLVTNASTGALVSGASLLLSAADGVSVGQRTTSAVGAFSFDSLAPGTYRVRALATSFIGEVFDNLPCLVNCQLTGGNVLTVNEGATVQANFALDPGGGLSGLVTDATTGEALVGVAVDVYAMSGNWVSSATTGADGSYSVTALPTGSYRARTRVGVRANHVDEAYGVGSCLGCPTTVGTPIAVTAGSTVAGVTFSLSPGGTIQGRVSSSNGFLMSATTIQVFAASGTLAKTVSTVTGVYAVTGLPTGSYFMRTSGASGQVDELHDGLPCLADCDPTTGTAVSVTQGSVTTVDFTLENGGAVSGVVRRADTFAPAGAAVGLYASSGRLAAVAGTDSQGTFVTRRLPAGTYYARSVATSIELGNQLFGGTSLCEPDCRAPSGTPIVVAEDETTANVDFLLPPAANVTRNGDFAHGANFWSIFATPSLAWMTWSFDVSATFSRLPPQAGTTNQAVVFQNTGSAFPSGTGMLAEFSLGGTTVGRRRISVLLHDADFSDLAVCTFWLPQTSLINRYAIRARTTKPWTNATISFYAATADGPDSFYTVAAVHLRPIPGAAPHRTDCVEPAGVARTNAADGPDLLVNGDFSSGGFLPGWNTFGQIQAQVAGGVAEFIKSPGVPAGVLFQATGQPLANGQIVTTTFQLGNSSAVRQRVTAILHDSDFSDLSACTFWVEPGQGLMPYAYSAITTRSWANATVSFYPATPGAPPWLRLDNVTLRRTPSAAIAGVECIEP